MHSIENILIPVVVFGGIWYILNSLYDFLLRKKLIKEGQYDRVGVLDAPKVIRNETNKYPSLKWGLVAFMAGLGFIIIEVLRYYNPSLVDIRNSMLPFGILLVSISLGFLIYFFVMVIKKK
ncbi:MAG: hypothetical protein CSA36_00285 [Draconibacterium sp.]|nr:MAG: hypothetical protein CSA36_00285 [Draconibacterium sp.]